MKWVVFLIKEVHLLLSVSYTFFYVIVCEVNTSILRYKLMLMLGNVSLSGYQHAFRKYSKHQINSHTTNYDFYSVMHYGMRSFTKNGGLTIRPRDPAVKRLGGTRLSEMDIQETNLMYKCDKSGLQRRQL